MPREELSRRCKRSRPMMESDNIDTRTRRATDCSSSIPVIEIGDDDDPICEDINSNKTFQPRRRSKTEPVKPAEAKPKLAPIFLPRVRQKEREEAFVPPKPKTPKISEATRQFLYSGVPEAIAKNQQMIKKKKIESDLMDTHEIFPLLTHVNVDTSPPPNPTQSKHHFGIISGRDENPVEHKPRLATNLERIEPENSYTGEICCGINKHQRSKKLLDIMKRASNREYVEPLPWVIQYQATRREYLVMKQEAHNAFKDWLKQWTRDIREDGGASRKIMKKRRKGSEDDFIDDDDDEDGSQKHKSVLLIGPTGSAKSTMVNVLAKRCGFKVLEVNFSSRRSGQEVLRRVEEATLSRRIASASTVDNKHCLLLFRDIDQLYLEEDEGFHSAVAQLITTSLRPIVMTVTSDPNRPYPTIDSKIERKEPLLIHVGTPPVDLIISNVLLPIIKREIYYLDDSSDYDLDQEQEDLNYFKTILQSIVRHCKCDIKRSINQAQLLWSTSQFTLDAVHTTLCPTFDPDFTTGLDSAISEFSSKLTTQQEMDEIANKFKFVTDLDRLGSSSVSDPEYDGLPHSLNSYFNSNFCSVFSTHPNDSSIQTRQLLLFRNLTLQTDSESAQQEKDYKLYDDIVTNHLDQDGSRDYYDEVAYFRTMLKNTVINSIGHKRRHGRLKCHFSNLGRDVIDSFCANFDFPQRVQDAHQASEIVLDDL